MEIKEMKLPITIEAARNIIQKHTDSFGVFLDYDRICEYLFYFKMRLKDELKELRQLTGIVDYNPTDRDATLNFLIRRLGVPAALFDNGHGKQTLDQKVVEQCAKYYEGTGLPPEEFLSLYRAAAKDSKAVSTYKQFKDLPMSLARDRDNHRMVVAHPTWNILRTSRISASDPGLQTIDRDRSDIITAPKGYQLVRSDSGQIEPRIMWSHFFRDELIFNLIVAYNDAYFAYFDYVTMNADRERELRADFAKNFVKKEITPQMKEGRQQMKRISLAAGYGSSLPQNGGFDQELGQLYEARIVNHPKRKEAEQRIRKSVYNGCETFYGAFGSPVTPEETAKYKRNEKGWVEHVIRCGINNPIQTTASELMIFAVNKAESILREKCKDSHICYYKHDEGCFYLNEDAGDMDYANDLADCQSYKIPNWIPIYSELEVGRKEPHNDVIRIF